MGNPETSPTLHVNSVVVASLDQVSSDLGGQTVLLSMRSAMYYGFEGIGSRLWELVQSPARVGDVCEAIATEYDVDAARAEFDTLAFLRQLLEKGLLEVRSGA